MGFRSSASTLVFISKGKLQVKTADGYESHEMIEGYITDVSYRDRDTDYGVKRELRITMDDGTDTFTVAMTASSGYGNAFQNAAPNIDFNQQVTLRPTYKEETKDCSIFVVQNDQAIKWYFTRDHPNGMPEATRHTINNKEVLDFSAQDAFREAYMMEHLLPKMKEAAASRAAKQDGTTHSNEDFPQETFSDEFDVPQSFEDNGDAPF